MNVDHLRRREDHAATLFAVAVAGIGCAGALWPLVEHAITFLVFTGLGLAVLITGARALARVVRERREDRADLLAGAAWRTQHMPHLVATTAAATTGPVSPGVAGRGMS